MQVIDISPRGEWLKKLVFQSIVLKVESSIVLCSITENNCVTWDCLWLCSLGWMMLYKALIACCTLLHWKWQTRIEVCPSSTNVSYWCSSHLLVFFLDLKRGARVLFVLHLKSVKSEIVVRPICSSLISLKRGVGFYSINKIIIFVVSQSWHVHHCV